GDAEGGWDRAAAPATVTAVRSKAPLRQTQHVLARGEPQEVELAARACDRGEMGVRVLILRANRRIRDGKRGRIPNAAEELRLAGLREGVDRAGQCEKR